MIPKKSSLRMKAFGLLLVLAALVLAVVPVSSLAPEPGTAMEAGEITGIAFSSNNTVRGIQVVTMFQNTGNLSLSGLVNTVILQSIGGEVLAQAAIPCSGETILPGQEAMCIADLGSGIPASAVMLKTTVQNQDGTTLASREEQLQAGDVAGPDTAPPASAPGWVACLGVLAVAVLVGRVKRPPGRITLRSPRPGL